MVPVDLELEYRGKRYVDVSRGLAAVAETTGKDFDAALPFVRNVLRQYMTGVVRATASRMKGAWPDGTSSPGEVPGRLSRRSGGLARKMNASRISARLTSEGPVVSFQLTGVMAVHERGAVITPRTSQYLTIPLPAALDSRGVPLRKSARDWQNTFVRRSKRGNLLIFQKQGREIIPLYALKKSVRIPARLDFGRTFNAGLDRLGDEVADSVLREFING